LSQKQKKSHLKRVLSDLIEFQVVNPHETGETRLTPHKEKLIITEACPKQSWKAMNLAHTTPDLRIFP
jgi:hypothetical protein